jgi:hypothetical protein
MLGSRSLFYRIDLMHTFTLAIITLSGRAMFSTQLRQISLECSIVDPPALGSYLVLSVR